MNHYNLQGLCILNTRPREQAALLNQDIMAAGGQVINYPMLEIVPPQHAWFVKLPELNQIDQALFISANAVSFCFASLAEHKLSWPSSILVTAVGRSTALALQKNHIFVNHVPSVSDSEHVLELPNLQQVAEQTIVLFKGEGGRRLISDTLMARGANLIELDVYQRIMPNLLTNDLDFSWQDGAVDIILFTSQQAMQNLFVSLGIHRLKQLKKTPCLVVSNRLAAEAAKLGMQTILVCDVETIVESLHQFNKGRIHGQ